MDALNIIYILHRFPSLTETFVAEEILRVQRIGVKVHIYSLLPPKKELTHPVSLELKPQVCYVPGIYAPSLWWAQAYFLCKFPGQYLQLLQVLLVQPAPKFSIILKRIVTFLNSIWVAKELEKSQVQLVHTHFAWLSAAASLIVSQLLDLPFTITTHAFDIYSGKNDILELTTRMADRIVTISEFNKQAMLNTCGSLKAEKIKVIRCGIDPDNFHVKGRQLENKVFQITSVGSLIEKKGHEYLIRACSELKFQGLDFHCVIVGGGKLEQPLRALIHELELEDVVTMAGPQTQIWIKDRLCRSDLFVLACVVSGDGDRDGIPVSIMEALAMEVPVVSTPVSGIPELVQHGETGLLVPERSASSLAATITRLAQDKPLRQKLAQQGRTKVEKDYDITKNVSQLVELFQQVIEERAR